MKTIFVLTSILTFSLSAACNDAAKDGATSAAPKSAAASSTSSSAPAGAKSAAASASATASAAAAPAGAVDLGVLAGGDLKVVLTGEPPMALRESMGGGRGSGVVDDYTRKTSHPADLWKYNAAGGGGVFWAPSKKAVAVSNINLKLNADQKSVDLWIKSALVTEVKHTAGPEVNEVGPTKALANTGAGTCKLKTGEDADFYWWDLYSPGDFAHELLIVIVAKDAPDEDKKVALSMLRQVAYTEKAKPHFKKP